jgi:hypothetical protein
MQSILDKVTKGTSSGTKTFTSADNNHNDQFRPILAEIANLESMKKFEQKEGAINNNYTYYISNNVHILDV